jgi:predicted PurR-regulated permease PerM
MADARTDSWRWFWLATLLVGGGLLYLLSPILMPFVVSAALAYLGDPLVDRLEELRFGRFRLPRTAAVTVVFLAIFLGLTLLLIILVPQLEAQISALLKKLPLYMAWLRDHLLPWLHQHLQFEGGLADLDLLRDLLAKHWQQAGGILAGSLGSMSRSGLAVLGWLANILLIPVVTFYLLRDWDRLIAGLGTLLPRDTADTWVSLAQESDSVLSAFIRGQLAVMAALSVIYVLGLWLVGLDFALLIGLFAGLVSFVPYLGLILGILLAGVASVLQYQGFDGLLGVVAVFVVAQLLEGSVLTPRLVGERIGLHPVAVIFAVMAGGQLYGFFGILLALPVAAVAMVGLRHVFARYRSAAC